jgi:hypothetical protein
MNLAIFSIAVIVKHSFIFLILSPVFIVLSFGEGKWTVLGLGVIIITILIASIFSMFISVLFRLVNSN